MDIFPPTYDFPSDSENDTAYTDIHMDPASIPADPALVVNTPTSPFIPFDEEMEEEEDPEYESEEDPEEEPFMNPTSDDDMVEPNPTDEAPLEHAPTDDEPSDPSDDDISDSPSPVAAPLTGATDPALPSLRDKVYALGNRVNQLEHRLTELPGPGHFRSLEGRVLQMDRHMAFLNAQVFALERQVTDGVRDQRLREGADRTEIRNLRRRLQDLEDSAQWVTRR